MANEPQTGSGSGGAKSAPEEPRYTRDELPEYLGTAPHIVAGALSEERNQTFTVAQAQKLVAAWLKKPADVEQAQADPVGEEE